MNQSIDKKTQNIVTRLGEAIEKRNLKRKILELLTKNVSENVVRVLQDYREKEEKMPRSRTIVSLAKQTTQSIGIADFFKKNPTLEELRDYLDFLEQKNQIESGTMMDQESRQQYRHIWSLVVTETIRKLGFRVVNRRGVTVLVKTSQIMK